MATSSTKTLLTKEGVAGSTTSLKSSSSDGGNNSGQLNNSNNSGSKLRQVNNQPSSDQQQQQAQDVDDPTTIALKNLLDTMQTRFEQMSSGIISRIDEMGNKIDDLERTLAEITAQMENNNQNQQPQSNTGNGAQKHAIE